MMNKFKLILVIAALFASSIYLVADIRSAVLKLNSLVLDKIYSAYDYSKQKVNRYFDQVEQIKLLEAQNQELKSYKLLYDNLLLDYNHLARAHNLTQNSYKLPLSRVLAYEKIGSLSRFLMDYKDLNPSKSYGLIYENSAVGIMFEHDKKALALGLNDEKCAFSVIVGKHKTPAILQGGKNAIYINFITDYKELNIDDEVYTSGKDLIFAEGVYVGKIAEIIDVGGYKKALLKDYKTLSPYRYVYVSKLLNH